MFGLVVDYSGASTITAQGRSHLLFHRITFSVDDSSTWLAVLYLTMNADVGKQQVVACRVLEYCYSATIQIVAILATFSASPSVPMQSR